MTAVLGVGHDGTAKHRTRRSTALGLRRSACGAFGEGVARIAFAGATTRFAGWRGDVSAFPHPRATYPDDFIVERILPRLIAGADVDQRMQHVVQHLGSVDVHGIQQPSVPRSRALHGTPTRTPLPLNHARTERNKTGHARFRLRLVRVDVAGGRGEAEVGVFKEGSHLFWNVFLTQSQKHNASAAIFRATILSFY